LVSGWSADWDKALVAALERAPSRRYPLYWDRRSSKGDTAQRLLQARAGHTIHALSADDLFRDLLASVEALDRLAEPPLTTAMAVARLKRYLPNPIHRIDLHDLVMAATERVTQHVKEQPLHLPESGWAELQDVYERHLEATTPLLHLLSAGVRHDHDDAHAALWLDVLQRLLNVRRLANEFSEVLDQARHYPALLALQTMGVTAVCQGRDALLLHMLTEVEWRNPYYPNELAPAAQVLHIERVLNHYHISSLPRWDGNQLKYPASRMLKEDLRDVLRESVPDDTEYQQVVHSYEYRIGLAQESMQDLPGSYRAARGEYFLDRWADTGGPEAEMAFRKTAEATGPNWSWWSLVGGQDSLDEHLLAYRETIEELRRRR
jgi:hypothetical protein